VSGLRARAALLIAIAPLTGCYGGKPSDFGDSGNGGVPFGVVVSSIESARKAGLYVTSPDDDANCCWLAKDASFKTRVSARTRRVRLTVSLPQAGPYDQRPLDETVIVDGRARKTFRGLRSGVWALDVDIPAPAREREASVRAISSYSWTAAQQHLNGDTRDLSVQLRSVRAE
jgi:hypothetical protein